MPLDAYWAVAALAGWIVAAIFAAYAFGQAKQLGQVRRDNQSLAQRLSLFVPMEMDQR